MKIIERIKKIWDENQEGYKRMSEEHQKPLEYPIATTQSADDSIDLEVEEESDESETSGGLPDFEEVRAPWMIRVHNLQDELEKAKSEIARLSDCIKRENAARNEELKCAKELSQREIARLEKMLDIERECSIRERSKLGGISAQIDEAEQILLSLHSEANRKKREIDDYTKSINEFKSETRSAIRTKAGKTEIIVRATAGQIALVREHTKLNNEDMHDFVLRAINETILRDEQP